MPETHKITVQRIRERTQVQAEPHRPSTGLVETPITSLKLPNQALLKLDPDRVKSDAHCLQAHGVRLPIIALVNGEIVDGEDTLEAYRLNGETTAPVLFVEDRDAAPAAAMRLWLARRRRDTTIDDNALRLSLETIFEFDPSWIDATHFTMPDIDFALWSGSEPQGSEVEVGARSDQAPAITQPGDLWTWPSGHRLLCGNARDPAAIARLMDGKQASLLAADPPYGTTVAAISSSHEEWQEGSGMSDEEAHAFHADYLNAALPHLTPGSLAYLFMDGKGLLPLQLAVQAAGLDQKSLCVWDKEFPGQGGLYRNQAEFIVVSQYGRPPKGVRRRRRKGRTTVWRAPGYASFRPDRAQALADHACTKPQSILMDILLDASEPNQIVLDPFGGSGSITIAAERTKRLCYSVEIEARFCDIAVRRLHEVTRCYPVLSDTGATFEEVAASRGLDIAQSAAAPVHGVDNG